MHLYPIALAATLLWPASIAKPVDWNKGPGRDALSAEIMRQSAWNQAQDGQIRSLRSHVSQIDSDLNDIRRFATNPRPNPYYTGSSQDDIEVINPFQKVKLAKAMKNLGQVLHFLGQSVTLAKETITLSGAMASQVNSNTDGLEKTVPDMLQTFANLEKEMEKKFPGITKPRPVPKARVGGQIVVNERQLIDPRVQRLNRIHIRLIGNNPTRPYVSKHIITVIKLRAKKGNQIGPRM
ncbi:hypothetical protein K493DRAFT_303757 [Basidiobolus meristosporus CBS 931.73]|uniref:Uncharacterized protein n=1 Tax=Basidiobolus meristosporus CBS 931.73 TaxID=1314790 RepID=A0A1Y1Y294_9FUNG|nr:hypothetical protein K493DRAFT_303757 [Basidiobolus meristosporus CBS 931.73]|eukprot:ORX91846.1 hypothetical protein K493DRAFT_303757 [Basidiobolus meristosporus CBS 931.73]